MKLPGKNHRYNYIVPIIAMTADVLKNSNNKIFAYGMNDYISKPIDVTKFYEKLKKWATAIL